MKKELKIGLFIFILFCLLFVLYAVLGTIKNRKDNVSFNFIGVVDKVAYDVKGIPNLVVNGTEYYLSTGYNFDHQIEKGDSLIKLKDSNQYKLIKHRSGEVFVFKN